MTQEFEVSSRPHPPRVRAPWDWQVARWLSNIFSPPLVAAGTITAAAGLSATRSAWAWLWVYLFIADFLPVLFVGGLMQRGIVSSTDLGRREERFWPYGITLLCLIASGWLLLRGQAPKPMLAVTLAGLIQTCVLSAITLRWKISLHSATIATGVTFIGLSLGPAALPICLLIPLIAWARARLRRHTWLQTAAGASVGAASMWVALALVRTL